MDFFQAIILSIAQGITEFLPISSSGHLVLLREILGWSDTGVAFDAFTGLGTLTAVIVYYRKDVILILKNWLQMLIKKGRLNDEEKEYAKLGNYLIIATIPTLIVGFIIRNDINKLTHSIFVITMTTLIFAVLLALADVCGRKNKAFTLICSKYAFFYGIAQVISLIPGVSRSGITITAGLALGFNREAAARFSFLMSIPISAVTGLYGLFYLLGSHGNNMNWQLLGLSYIISTVVAFACIAIFIRFINVIGMWPFVIYRLALGIVLLCFFLI